jgi:hypothetical protein
MYLHTQHDAITWDSQFHLVTHGLVANNIVSSSGVCQYGPYTPFCQNVHIIITKTEAIGNNYKSL